MRRAIEESRAEAAIPPRLSENGASSSKVTLDGEHSRASRLPAFLDDDDDDNLYASPSRLETALSIGGAGPSRRPVSEARRTSGTSFPHSSVFGTPSLLLPETSTASAAPVASAASPLVVSSDPEDDDMEEVLVAPVPAPLTPPRSVKLAASSPRKEPLLVEDSDEDMEEVSTLPQFSRPPQRPIRRAPPQALPSRATPSPSPIPEERPPDSPPRNVSLEASPEVIEVEQAEHLPQSPEQATPASPPVREDDSAEVPEPHRSSDSEDDEAVPWDRPPSPQPDESGTKPTAVPSTADGWDAADEMDPHAEEGEFARFISQVRGKDIESVRKEIDDEIRELNQQRKAAMRDSEDITQQMISQIMVSPFVIPIDRCGANNA